MTPPQFNSLNPGDVIRDAHGREFTIISRHGEAIIAQHAKEIPVTHSGRWTVAAKLCRIAPTALPALPTLSIPSLNVMLADLRRAGYTPVRDSANRQLYSDPYGTIFPGLGAAWDAVQKGISGGTLTNLNPENHLYRHRLALLNAGWRLVNLNRTVWESPSGEKFYGTKRAHDKLTKVANPTEANMREDLFNAGWNLFSGVWFRPGSKPGSHCGVGQTAFAWFDLKGIPQP